MDIVCSPRPIDRGAQTNCHFLIAPDGHRTDRQRGGGPEEGQGEEGMKLARSLGLCFSINREKVAQRAGCRGGRCQVCKEGKGREGESESAIEMEGRKEGRTERRRNPRCVKNDSVLTLSHSLSPSLSPPHFLFRNR